MSDNTKDTPMDYNKIGINDKSKVASVAALTLLKENKELKLELQKQKELNAELVEEVETAMGLHWLPYNREEKIKSIIKKCKGS